MPRSFLSVPDMHCDGCVASVKKALASVDPLAHVTVELEARRIEVDSPASEADLLAALRGADWEASAAEAWPKAPRSAPR